MTALTPPPKLSKVELIWRLVNSLIVLAFEVYFFSYSKSILGHIITAIVALLAAGFIGRDLYYKQRG